MSLVREKIALLLYPVLGGGLALFYFRHYPLPGFWLRLYELFLTAFFVAVCMGVGRKLLCHPWFAFLPFHVAGFRERQELDACIWSLGLGGAFMGLSLFLLGILGAYSPVPFALWTGFLFLLSYGEIKTSLHALLKSLESLRSLHSLSGTLLFAGALLVLGGAALCALAPPTYYDSLVYHLALPAKYLQNGRITFVPSNHYSHFPQNMELIFGWFLAFRSDISAQLLNVFLGGFLTLLLWRFGKKQLGLEKRFDLLLLLTAPCFLLLSSETYVEIPLAFWTFLAVAAGVKGLRSGARSWLVYAGVMAGFATGIKYTGVITAFILGGFILLWPREQKARERWGDFAFFAGAAFLVFLPWLLKNYFFTGGNPFFPFFPGLFPADNVYLHKEASEAYFRVLNEYKDTSFLLLQFLKLPLKMLSDSVSLGGGYDVTGDLGWALPLVLSPLLFFFRRSEPAFYLVLVYVVLHVVVWASLRPVLRFLFPVFPLLCLLLGSVLEVYWKRLGRVARGGLLFFLGLFVLSNGVLFYWVERVRDPFPVALGLETRSAYLEKKLDVYPAYVFMNRELPRDSRVLFVGDQRGYYCERSYLAPMALLPQPLALWSQEAESASALGASLREKGFTHILFHRKEARRLESYGVLDLGPEGMQKWDSLLTELSRLYDQRDVAVYSLRKETAARG